MKTITKAVVYGTLASGTLDAVNGVIFNHFAHNMNPVQVLQYIASGFYGADAFNMGLTGAAIGALSHYGIALVLMAIYLAATHVSGVLNRVPELFGPLYGAAVFLTMNFVVLPLTNVVHVPITQAFMINGLIGHALLVGLPIAIFARRAAAPEAPHHHVHQIEHLAVLK